MSKHDDISLRKYNPEKLVDLSYSGAENRKISDFNGQVLRMIEARVDYLKPPEGNLSGYNKGKSERYRAMQYVLDAARTDASKGDIIDIRTIVSILKENMPTVRENVTTKSSGIGGLSKNEKLFREIEKIAKEKGLSHLFESEVPVATKKHKSR